jgi:DNA-binding beta-propeller fold protein YncE
VDADDNVYVSDHLNSRVEEFSPQGRYIRKWGRAGRRPGQFILPFGLAVDGRGNLYVADEVNRRVEELSPGGAILHLWGGPHQTLFDDPSGIVLRPNGEVVVLDQGRCQIVVISGDQSVHDLLPSSHT